MALNSSGPISLAGTTAGQSIQLELKGTGVTVISLNDTEVRKLANVVSGQISMPANFWGKSSNEYWIMYADVAGANVPNISYDSTSKMTYLWGVIGTSFSRTSYIIKYNNDTNAVLWSKVYTGSNGYGVFPWMRITSLGLGQDGSIYIGGQTQPYSRMITGDVSFVAIVNNTDGSLTSTRNLFASTYTSASFPMNRYLVDTTYPTTWRFGYQNGRFQILNSNSTSPVINNISSGTDESPGIADWENGTTFYLSGGSSGLGSSTYPSIQQIVNGAITMKAEFGTSATTGSSIAVLNPVNNYLYIHARTGTSYWLFRYTTSFDFVDSGVLLGNYNPSSMNVDSDGNIYLLFYPHTDTSIFLVVKLSPALVILWQRQFQGPLFSGANLARTKFSDGMYLNITTVYATSVTKSSLWKLPTDGSKTGTYTVLGQQITYSVASSYIYTLTAISQPAVTKFGGGAPTAYADYGTQPASTANSPQTVSEIQI